MLRRSKPFIGIDINDSIWRLIFLEKDYRNKYRVVDFAQIKNNDLIGTLMELKKIVGNSQRCAIALPYSVTRIQTIQFNTQIKDEEIMELLRLNADKYFFHPFDELCVDFECLQDELKTNRKKLMRIVAAKQQEVARLINQFQDVGINLKIMDVDSLAMERVIKFLNIVDESVVAVFLIRNNSLLQIMFNNGQCEAYEIMVVASDGANLAIEMERFLRLSQAKNIQGAPISKILLFGEKMLLDTIKPFIEQKMNVRVLPINPFLDDRVAINDHQSLSQNGSAFAICFGLAMHSQQLSFRSLYDNKCF
jgi:Tfp pilus assembly PilM family ATPase